MLRCCEVSGEQVKAMGGSNGRGALNFQVHHDSFAHVTMSGHDTFRTAKLCPDRLFCKQMAEKRPHTRKRNGPDPVAWNYTFDVAILRTSNSFINVGLVEWSSQSKEPQPLSADRMLRTLSAGPMHLSELLEAQCSDDHDGGASESRRQMMIGCKKGVKWYGSSRNGQTQSETMFKDDLCEGTTLRFCCECTFTGTDSLQVRLWLLPSVVNFYRGGQQMVQLSKPLFEYPMSWDQAGLPQAEVRTMWVPAVTLYTKGDQVIFGWCGGRPGGDASSQPST